MMPKKNLKGRGHIHIHTYIHTDISVKIATYKGGTRGNGFLVALITFSIDFLVALNTKHEVSCCSKYHRMSFLVALNTISMGFLVALITHSMDVFVALKRYFQRKIRDL